MIKLNIILIKPCSTSVILYSSKEKKKKEVPVLLNAIIYGYFTLSTITELMKIIRSVSNVDDRRLMLKLGKVFGCFVFILWFVLVFKENETY